MAPLQQKLRLVSTFFFIHIAYGFENPPKCLHILWRTWLTLPYYGVDGERCGDIFVMGSRTRNGRKEAGVYYYKQQLFHL